MDLLTFAKACGVMMEHVPPIGVWRRFPTESHPRKRNGAVKFMGDHAFVCDWAAGSDVHVWKADESVVIDREKMRRMAMEAKRRIADDQRRAAAKAAWILGQCDVAKHQYLKDKGFPDEYGSVWVQEGVQLLVIPMRISGSLVGCQLIKPDGEKKFLYGQRTGGATFTFDNKGPHVLCEGFATALSVRAALKAIKRRYTLHVCFSAGNMEKVAVTLPRGLVIADNDRSATGEQTAKKIGWQYFMPPDQGQDFNDFHQKVGLFRASQALAKALSTLQP